MTLSLLYMDIGQGLIYVPSCVGHHPVPEGEVAPCVEFLQPVVQNTSWTNDEERAPTTRLFTYCSCLRLL